MKIENNKIYNVDAYRAIKSIASKSVDLIYIDVPYQIGIGGGGGFGQNRKSFRKELIDKNLTDGFDFSILDEAVRVLKKINIFVWCSRLQILPIMNYFSQYETISMELLFWGKSNAIPATNNTWLPDVEYCIYFRESNVLLNQGYQLKSKFFISPINQADRCEFGHPTIKPLELVKRHILHTTNENDLVLDFFLGSGTTAVACKETNRQFIGFEIDADYFKIASNRLNGINQHGQTSIFTDFELLGAKS